MNINQLILKYQETIRNIREIEKFIQDFEKISELQARASYSLRIEGREQYGGAIYLTDVILDKKDLLKKAKGKLNDYKAFVKEFELALEHVSLPRFY